MLALPSALSNAGIIDRRITHSRHDVTLFRVDWTHARCCWLRCGRFQWYSLGKMLDYVEGEVSGMSGACQDSLPPHCRESLRPCRKVCASCVIYWESLSVFFLWFFMCAGTQFERRLTSHFLEQSSSTFCSSPRIFTLSRAACFTPTSTSAYGLSSQPSFSSHSPGSELQKTSRM